MRKRILAVIAVVVLLIAAFANPVYAKSKSPQKSETQIRQDAYSQLVAKQPAHGMDYSPSRDTINFWIDTWKEPGKLSYVYLLASNGQMVGYYVFQGLPVSMCASLTPSYDKTSLDLGDSHGQAIVPAPGVDGVYYSGGQCTEYYGKDASTGAYIEYSSGSGINALVYSEPLPKQKAEPLGFTTVDQAAAIAKK